MEIRELISVAVETSDLRSEVKIELWDGTYISLHDVDIKAYSSELLITPDEYLVPFDKYDALKDRIEELEAKVSELKDEISDLERQSSKDESEIFELRSQLDSQ